MWKFRVDPCRGWQEVQMPEGAEPIHYIERALWAIVDPDAPLVEHLVGVWGTGWEIPEGARHVHTDVGSFVVYHLFVPEATP